MQDSRRYRKKLEETGDEKDVRKKKKRMRWSKKSTLQLFDPFVVQNMKVDLLRTNFL